ncbi:potassium channel protein [Bacillus luteolus]|uniref:Potassium channel protein n=1 Tax=Litchfieldia luteola TaxID=682179 RepID=A0ABR9QG61_9BACI|nr:potassium channel protein [Cytobacillus luteolus]MBE4907477.1 potassium channel protein [Cytobacillus luteolus]MBP1944244.1 voltage-gated potassium channel [Cytobacillus luteolus]
MRTNKLLITFLRWPIISRVLLIIFLIIIFFGSIIHLIEPENFPTVFDGIWWALVTTSTVGFGDYVPSSIAGRSLGMVLILFGTGFVTTYFVTLAATAVTNQNSFLDGKMKYYGDKHIIIVGWNERVRIIIEQLIKLDSSVKILLIDETLKENPNPKYDIHFIKGNPTVDETLLKADINHAEMVILTADQSKDEQQADMLTILTLIAIKGLNPDAYCIVEILAGHQVNNAKRAGANEIIETNHISGLLMVNDVVSHGMSDILVTMLDQLKGSKLKYIELSKNDVGMTFQYTSSALLKERIILLGVKRGENSYINPPLSYTLEENDELLVIKD